jgi:hypothetical protein
LISPNLKKNRYFDKKNSKFFKSFIFIPTVLIFGFILQNIGFFIPSIANVPFRTFIDAMSQWLNINYFEFGFIRRAFIGTLISFINNSFYKELFFIIFNLFIIILTFYIIFRKFFEIDKSFYKFIFIVFALSPLGAMQIGYTFGRFEHINFFLIIAGIKLIDKNKYYLSSLIITCGLLIHEAFFIYGVPLILIYSIEKFKKIDIKKISILFIPVISFAIYLAFYGNSEKAALLSALGANRGLVDIRQFEITDSVLFLYLYLIIINHIYILKNLKLKITYFDFAPYLTLSLFILGLDYARWIGILFYLIIISIYIKVKDIKKQSVYKFELRFTSICLAFPFFGPIGIVYAYPVFNNFLQLIGRINF